LIRNARSGSLVLIFVGNWSGVLSMLIAWMLEGI